MKVRVGWATEYGRDRFDVEVEEPDLERILRENGMDGPGVAGRLKAAQAFLLLHSCADWLAASAAVRAHPGTDRQAAQDLAHRRHGQFREVVAVVKRALREGSGDQPAG